MWGAMVAELPNIGEVFLSRESAGRIFCCSMLNQLLASAQLYSFTRLK